jgi:ribonuclease PH
MKRQDGRAPGQLRRLKFELGALPKADGSVLISTGHTRVLCTASIEEEVPSWRKDSGLGWVTAEYEMLPASTGRRRPRSRSGKVDGRAQEIQRLIGRSLRAVVNMQRLGPRSIWIDCDVLQADGGTRTAAITGGYLALVQAVGKLQKAKLIAADPILDRVAAVSVGLVDGRVLVDLNYEEDVRADVDFTVVMTGRGRFVEVQGAAEGGTFARPQMLRMISAAASGIRNLHRAQARAIGRR